jgi:hypothetical protein
VLRYEWVSGERRSLEVGDATLALSAKLDSEPLPPARAREMGDLVLSPAPLVASGRVVDREGKGVAGASVQVEKALQAPGGTSAPAVWMLLPIRSAKCDASGAFVLRGDVEERTIRLSLGHEEELRAAPVVVRTGATGVELVALRTGGLAGRLLLDPGVQTETLRVHVHPDGLPEEPIDERWLDGDKRERRREGIFEFEELLPGSYTLTVDLNGVRMTEIPGVAVESGQVARDPRVQEIDLRGQLHVFAFELVPPAPMSELDASVDFTPRGESEPEGHAYFQGTKGQLATRFERVDATLRVSGYRSERLTDLGPRTEVRLRPGLAVRLVLPRGLSLPQPPLALGATLGDPDGRSIRATARLFDENGELRCTVSDPGRFTVVWLLERNDSGNGSRGGLEIPPEQLVGRRRPGRRATLRARAHRRSPRRGARAALGATSLAGVPTPSARARILGVEDEPLARLARRAGRRRARGRAALSRGRRARQRGRTGPRPRARRRRIESAAGSARARAHGRSRSALGPGRGGARAERGGADSRRARRRARRRTPARPARRRAGLVRGRRRPAQPERQAGRRDRRRLAVRSDAEGVRGTHGRERPRAPRRAARGARARARASAGLLGEILVDPLPPGSTGARRARLELRADWDLAVEVVDEALAAGARGRGALHGNAGRGSNRRPTCAGASCSRTSASASSATPRGRSS